MGHLAKQKRKNYIRFSTLRYALITPAKSRHD